ncbi:MAG: uncharacterized protein JWN93_3422, partial [Hyphomicrobiales bacterium]|nr:uncharacterized protein [Hyphomicrobiales bacterium]
MPDISVKNVIAPDPGPARLPRRAFWAILAGFLIVSSGIALLSPWSGDLAAQEDDSAASYWARDRRARAAPATQNPSLSRVTTIFGDFFARPARLPAQVRQAANRRSEQALARARDRRIAREAKARDHARERAARLAAVRAEPPMDPSLVSLTSAIESRPRPRVREALAVPTSPVQPRGVCVRLCDGSHFPAPVGDLTDASCASVCPGAPTRAYLMRSDGVQSAVSVRDGAPYAALPVALRYTQKADNTCSCGRGDLQSRILRDATLRRGDRVMTDEGFRLFRGGASPPFSRGDFNTIADAKDLPRHERRLLSAMERAAGVAPLPSRPQPLASAAAKQPAPAP